MKSPLLKKMRGRKHLERSWAAIRRNARQSKSQETRDEVSAFEADLTSNIQHIQRQLRQGTFQFPPARGLRIKKKNRGHFRPLVIAPLASRIVQRAIHDVLVDIPALQVYVKTPYSFGGIRKVEKAEMAAVPAAISAVLDAIGEGCNHIIRSDISAFFTRIPKPKVTSIVEKAINDVEFLDFFSKAIKVELENLANLRKDAAAFPIEDLGVAQGNSLSPLLGNIFLYEFDMRMNEVPGIRCIRYIDDFIILAPSKSSANNHFFKARALLENLGLKLSKEKTEPGHSASGFEFLGIELQNGLIRPSKSSRQRLIDSVAATLSESAIAFRNYNNAQPIEKRLSLLNTLRKVGGTMQGWGKHYRFCNDGNCLSVMDRQIVPLIRAHLGAYSEARKIHTDKAWDLMGIESLSQMERRAFIWPK